MSMMIANIIQTAMASSWSSRLSNNLSFDASGILLSSHIFEPNSFGIRVSQYIESCRLFEYL